MAALTYAVVAIAIVALGVIVALSKAPDTGPCHSRPDEPFSCAEAHEVWRDLINCDVETCPKKQAAFDTLVEAKKVTPSTSRVAK